jgi:hypothetical protein
MLPDKRFHIVDSGVVPQNVVRREMLAVMLTWVTERTELGPSRALATA